jgi:hypothetical protein
MITVVDASVVIKWLLQNPAREADTEQATPYCPTIRTTWFYIGGCNNQRAAEEL